MSDIEDEYRNRKLYSHDRSKALRNADTKPGAKTSELGNLRLTISRERSEFADRAHDKRRKLDNKQKIESSRSPHASFAQKHMLESRDLDKELATEKRAMDADHKRKLEAAKQKAMPR
jgi:hypothetical protein